MRVAVHAPVAPNPFRLKPFPEGSGLYPNFKKAMHLVLAMTLYSLLLGSGGCAGTDTRPEVTLPPSEELNTYLQTADHLTEEQKKEMSLRRPFVGMTVDEANIGMRRESTGLIVSGTAVQAVYVGRSGVRYQLFFRGDPPRVVDWTSISDDQLQLTDPDLLRPTPPVRPF